jgi:hypothetical protein
MAMLTATMNKKNFPTVCPLANLNAALVKWFVAQTSYLRP